MVTYKTWLGRVVGGSFRQAWKDFWCMYEKENDGGYIGQATKAFIKFPFEGLEPILISIYNRFYWISADIIQQMGCNIGDSSMRKIDETLKTAKDYAIAKVDEAKRYVQSQFIKPLQDKAKALDSQMKAAQAKVDEFNRVIQQTQSRLSNIETTVKQVEQAMSDKAKALDSQMKAAQAKVDEFNRVIEQAQSRLDNVETQMDRAQSGLADLNRLIDETKATLESHEKRIQELEGKKATPFELPQFPLKI